MNIIDKYNKKVFISYVRENAAEVKRICDAFEKNGINYWIDRDEIDPGKIWKLSIKEAINKGAYFLACFSREYEEKQETYMNEELLLGIEILRIKSYNSGWLIPIKLSPCEIPQIDIGANKTLQDLQYLDFSNNWDIEIGRLIDLIKRESSPEQTEEATEYLKKEYTYRGLKSLIESGSSVGFHNRDMGHPVYRIGASDASIEMLKGWEYADSPEKNTIFKMLSKLSKELKEAGVENSHYVWWYDFSKWRDYCKFVIDTYDKRINYK